MLSLQEAQVIDPFGVDPGISALIQPFTESGHLTIPDRTSGHPDFRTVIGPQGFQQQVSTPDARFVKRTQGDALANRPGQNIALQQGLQGGQQQSSLGGLLQMLMQGRGV